ncbi:dTDP-4-dehydrorhamnose reductase [Candidatus Phycosocius bacilliformis]|uniref:dTDP-4-dehydrorhamnose reductase n=1 Tax=Candidatus Phycosocius bacilliformis TaxID=1445552 RepID=A0A2P2E6H5_9PROT|nr:dTDP-4-dehydrorhamnose reductase [Candidatus Phycosocius bacilliformis]GBF56666.1 dTDP-4-dehydrorhamnose reductase [Candidatus Phycosocius bacilliformis]
MKLLVFGQQGQLAQAVAAVGPHRGIDVTCLGRSKCNITSPTDVTGWLTRIRPDLVLNAAAFTAVDAAETQVDQATALNTTAPQFLARATMEHKIAFLHVSTDYVFDGRKAGPYVETDPTHPLNVYGQTKRDGELAVLDANPTALVVRTSWVFSPFAHNFVRTILKRAQERVPLSVVDDQTGAPTSALDLADACLTALQAKHTGSLAAGIFHYTSSGQTSWYGLAREILDQTQDWRPGFDIEIKAVTTDQFKTAAVRPRNSVLDCRAFVGQFGHVQPNWRDSLSETLVALKPEFGAST